MVPHHNRQQRIQQPALPYKNSFGASTTRCLVTANVRFHLLETYEAMQGQRGVYGRLRGLPSGSRVSCLAPTHRLQETIFR
jgi:hypothetical protein